jgi:hypothetical protein
MTDHMEIIKRLEKQNALVDTTETQREANNFRIQWLTWLHRDINLLITQQTEQTSS